MNAYLASTVAIIVAVLALVAFFVTACLYRSHVRDLRVTIDCHRAVLRGVRQDRDLWHERARRRLENLGRCRSSRRRWQRAHRKLVAEMTARAADWDVVDRNTEHWATDDGHAQRDAAFRQIVSVLPSDDAVNLGLWTSELDPETCLLAESLTDNPGQVDQ